VRIALAVAGILRLRYTPLPMNLTPNIAGHAERNVAVGEGGGDTESKHPVSPRTTSIRHSTGSFVSLRPPFRLRCTQDDW